MCVCVCFEQISASTYSDAKKRGHASARVTFPAVYLLEAADNFVEFKNADYLSLSLDLVAAVEWDRNPQRRRRTLDAAKTTRSTTAVGRTGKLLVGNQD